MDSRMEDIDDAELTEELNFCNHFLVGFKLQKEKHCVFNFAMSSFNNSFQRELGSCDQPTEMCGRSQPCFRICSKNIEDGTCRYFYAHENYTVMEKSNIVSTQQGMVNLNENLHKTDVVDHCNWERDNS